MKVSHKYIVVDSQFRDQGDANDYRLNLYEPIKDVVNIQLCENNIPADYNLVEPNVNDTFYVTTNATVGQNTINFAGLSASDVGNGEYNHSNDGVTTVSDIENFVANKGCVVKFKLPNNPGLCEIGFVGLSAYWRVENLNIFIKSDTDIFQQSFINDPSKYFELELNEGVLQWKYDQSVLRTEQRDSSASGLEVKVGANDNFTLSSLTVKNETTLTVPPSVRNDLESNITQIIQTANLNSYLSFSLSDNFATFALTQTETLQVALRLSAEFAALMNMTFGIHNTTVKGSRPVNLFLTQYISIHLWANETCLSQYVSPKTTGNDIYSNPFVTLLFDTKNEGCYYNSKYNHEVDLPIPINLRYFKIKLSKKHNNNSHTMYTPFEHVFILKITHLAH